MTEQVYALGDSVVFHFPKDLRQWPIQYDKYPQKYDGRHLIIIAHVYTLGNHYYILSEIGNYWIKESFLEPVTEETEQITKDEFNILLEV